MKHRSLVLVLVCLVLPQVITASEGIPLPSSNDDDKLNLNSRSSIGESIPLAKDDERREAIPQDSDEDDVEITDNLERMLEQLEDMKIKGVDVRSGAPPTPPSFDAVQKAMNEKAKKKGKGKKSNKKQEEDKNFIQNQLTGRTADKRTLSKRELIPKSYGIDMDSPELISSHPNKKMREGFATDTHTCDHVRPITEDMRAAAKMYLAIDPFYYHYTEAFGILCIGSRNVTEQSLSRCCYVVKTLFGSRYDIRQAYYKFYGRVALIGDGEQQTSLPEYQHEPSSLNSRVRGLGPTIHKPLTSAGDDNQCCRSGDRYHDQDIAVHELAHAVEQLAADYVIPGFAEYLLDIYTKNVVDLGKWANSYAATNTAEYFAVGVQMYFNTFSTSSYINNFNVYGRESLRAYDSDLAALLDLVFPCAIYDDHILIDRCSWKKCDTGTNFALMYSVDVKARSNCEQVAVSYSQPTADHCANFTCKYADAKPKANVFNWKNSECRALACPEPARENMNLTQGQGAAFNIYYPLVLPEMTLDEELQQFQDRKCTEGPQGTSRCNGVPKSQRRPYGASDVTKRQCKSYAGCWGSDVNGVSHCFFPDQRVADRSYHCPAKARAGLCDVNPNFMYYYCPMACNIVDHIDELPSEEILKTKCGDFNIYCDSWAAGGECERNPNFMNPMCKISCGGCTPTNPIF